MKHGQNSMSSRQAGRGNFFLRHWWFRALIVCGIFINLGFAGLAQGSGGGELGKYIHAASGKQKASAAAFDSDGSQVIVGFTQATAIATEDYYVLKITADGNSLAWAAPVTFNLAGGTDQAIAVVIDSQSNVVVTGTAFNGVTYDIHTVKYNGADGAVLWQNTFNGTYNGDDSAAAMALDDNDNIYIGGYTLGANGLEDFLILKYNSTGPIGGKPTWKKTYNGAANNVDKINAIAVSHGASPYVAATGISRNATNFDILTVKYDSAGTFVWAKVKDGGAGDDWGKQVKLDSAGDVVVAGYVNNGLNADLYLAKYTGNTATPTVDWQVTYDAGYGDEPRGLAIDAANNVYVTGFTFSMTGFNNYFTAKYYGTGAGKGTLAWPAVRIYNSGGDNGDTALGIAVSDDAAYVTGIVHKAATNDDDIVTIKYKKDNGNEIWVSTFNGTQGLDDNPVGVGVSDDGKIQVAGWTAVDAFDYDFVGLRLDPGALNTPTDLAVTLISQSEVRLDWTLNSTTETGVQIFRKIGASSQYSDTPTYTVNGTGIASYNDTACAAHTKYYYKIRVFDNNGAYSNFSNEVSKLTSVYNYVAPTWTYKYAGPDGSDDVANAVAIGPDHHPVVTGYSFSLVGSFDYYTVKLNYSTALPIWSVRYDDPDGEIDEAQTVTVDTNNDAIVSGYSSLYSSGAENTLDLYTIKYYGASGLSFDSPIWTDQIDGPQHGDDRATAIASTKDASNNIIVIGYGRNLAGNDDIIVVKYLANGTRAWSPELKVYDGGGMDRPSALAIDGNGDIIVTGRMHNGSNFDIFTRKYSGTDGSTVWTVIKSGGFGDDEGLDLAVGSDNSVYVTGYLTNASLKKDIYTVKYKAANPDGGQELWVGGQVYDGAAHGNDWASSVRIDTNGDDNNVVVAGTTEQATAGKHEYIVIRYDSTGADLWTRILDRPANNDVAVAMGMDVTGNICIAGNSDDSGTADIMTVKYGYDGEIIGTTLYNGPANGIDEVTSVAVSRLGHAYVSGYSGNSGGNYDFFALKCEGNLLQSPSPFGYTAYYQSIDFTWVNNTLDADGFKMRRQVGSCATADPDLWTWFSFTSAQASYTDTGLNIGTTYCYQLQAYKNNGDESRWLEKTITTVHPPAPSNFVATVVDTTKIKLTWTDNLNGEDTFEIKRCTGSGTSCDEDSEFTTNLASLAAGVVTYDDVTACANTTYTYRIQGVKDGYWDSYWAYATATTPAVATPSMTTAVTQSEGRIDLTWTDTNTDHTGFKVYRCDATAVPGCTPAELAGTILSNNVLALGMDESAWNGTAAEIKDTSGAGNHGRAYNAVTTIVGGHTNRAGSFDGVNDYVSWAYTDGTPVNNFTMAAWVKATTTHEIDAESSTTTTGTANQKYLFYPDNKNADSGAGISVGTNGISVYEHGAGYMPPLAVYSGALGTGWNHVVVTYTDKQPRIYLNGNSTPVRVGLASTKANVYAPTRVGGDNGGYGFLAATVDEVAVYNRALSGAEVTALFNNQLENVLEKFTDMPLAPNTNYRYAVAVFKTAVDSCNGGWETAPVSSGVLAATTDDVSGATHVPVLLTTVKDTTEVTSKINLTWQDKSETEENFAIERCAGAACDFSTIDATYTVAANSTAYSDVAACQGAYRYRVSAKRTTTPVWQSNPSNILGATTNTMADPSGLTWDSANSNEEQIKLSWTAGTTDETGFEIWRCAGSGCSDFGAGPVATVARGVTTYTNTRLNPDTVYIYKVRAVKNSGCSWQTGFSSTVETNTNVANKGSLNLTASALNTTRIDLGWSDITGNESGFVLERCSGTCDAGGSFGTQYGIGVGVTSYSDVAGVCQGQTYSYRLKAIDQDFSYGYNGCWTKRVQLTTITGFQADSVNEFTVNFAAGMQADFDDLRFYQFTDGTLTDGQVLPHWIVKKTDSTNAVVWLKTSADANFIYMYYGNPNATKVPNGGGVFEFYDDFAGTTIDSSKWENDIYGKMYLDNGLKLVNDGTTTYNPFTSKAKFSRDATRTLYYRTTPSATGSWYAGLSTDIVNASNTFVHGLYYNSNYVYVVYENGTATNYPYKYFSYGYPYEIKVVYYVAGGAKYYIRGGGGSYVYNTWTSIYDSTVRVPPATNTPMRVKVLQYQGALVMDTIGVVKNDTASVTLNLGAVQGDGVACYLMPHEWASAYSNIVTETAKTATPPADLSGTALSESELSLSWTASTPDVTGVKLLRCDGDAAACAAGSFTQVAAIGAAPVVRLEMDEASWNGTASEIKDGIGGKNHATSYNGANTVADGHSGRAGGFDGANDLVGLTYADGVPTNNFTLAAWVKATTTHEIDTEASSGTTGTAGQKYLLAPDLQTTGSGAGVSVGTNGISVYEHSGGYLPPLAVYSGELGTDWNHIVVTYTNKQPRIYLNGTLVRTGMTSPKTTVFAPTVAGGHNPYGYFAGTVDELAIYNQALSADEVRNLYQLGSKSYIDAGLNQNAWYTYKLAAYKGAADANCTWDESTVGYSAGYSLKTQAPPAPEITGANALNTTDIALTWTDLTGSNTGFAVQRSELVGTWSEFATVGTTEGNATSFTDKTACKNTQYKFRIVAVNEIFPVSFSNEGGAGWARRKPLTIADFQANFQTRVVISYDSDMRADFADLRFRDETAGVELPYWIESQTNGVSATVWVKTGANNNINLYYGNYNATSAGNGVATFTLFDDFNDNLLDAKWTITVDAGGLPTAETGGVIRFGTSAATTNAKWSRLRSVATYSRNYIEEYKLQVTSYSGSTPKLQDPNAYYVLQQDGTGWRWNYWNPGASFRNLNYSSNIAYGSGFVKVKLVRNDTTVGIYENDVLVSTNPNAMSGAYSAGLDLYEYEYGAALVVELDDYRIRAYAATEPSVTLGAEASGTTVNWTSDPSAESASVTTPDVIQPVLNSATRVSEAQIDLAWTWSDATSDETGFNVERCEGVATNCVTYNVPANTASFTDKGLKNDQEYCYRLSAFKTAPGSCADGWDSGYSLDQRCVTSTALAPTVAAGTGVTTQAANSTQVDIVWTDNSNSEEGFIFWRCLDNGSNNCLIDGNYSDISATAGLAGANRAAWSDTTVCSASTYFYKAQAYSNGPSGTSAPVLSNAGGGTWSRRARVNISAGFQADYQTRIVVAYDSDMQADFDDLRFYDEVAEQELPYWIEKKTNGASATVWFKTNTTNASISLYYGNAAAGASSSGAGVFGAGSFGTRSTSGTLNGPFVNTDGFTIEAGVVVYVMNSLYSSVKFDATGSYQGTLIQLYETNPRFYRYDYNSGGGQTFSEYSNTFSYPLNSAERWTIKVKNQSYWLLLNDVQQKTNTNLPYASGAVVYSSGSGAIGGYFDYILVRKYAATEPTVVLQAEEVTPVQTWVSAKSAADDATTPTVSTPTLDQTNTKRLTENQAQVAWTDVNPDESYFIVERGNAACDSGSFVVIGNTGTPNVFTHTDTGLDLDATYGLPVGQTFCYRVRPYKTSSCPWPEKYSDTKTVTLDVPAPTNLTAVNTETTVIHLEWDDVTKTETGFDIYRCTGQGVACDEDGEFASVGSRGQHTTLGVKVTYDDSTACPAHTYTYRIKAVRTGNWTSPFSAGAAATTIATVAPSALSETEIYDATLDQRKINLYWTDTNADETGFKIERCNYTVSGNCDGVNFTEVGTHGFNLNETFASQIDPAVWTLSAALQSSSATLAAPLSISNSSGLASISWSNGKAVMRTTSVNLAEANYNYSRLKLVDPELLGNSNVDMTFDYNLPSGAGAYAQYNVNVRLQITYPKQAGKTNIDQMYVERSRGQYYVYAMIKDVASSYTLATTDTSGKFRVNRTADILKVYVWQNNAWTQLLSHAQTLAAGVMPTAVHFTQFAQRNEAQDLTTEIDNIKIDATRLKFSDLNGTYPLDPSSTYHYRVRAYKTHSAACSEWNDLYTNTVNEPTNPATPTSLVARAAGSKKMELLWTDNATDEDGYIVEKKTAVGGYIEIAVLAADQETYLDTINLDPDTSYTYRLRAFRNSDSSYSPYSNEATGKTYIWGKLNSDDTTCLPEE